MNDYEFVKGIYDGHGSCGGKTGDDCEVCPICKGTCFPDRAVYEKAKAWLENYKKENSMDGIKVTVEEKKVEEKAEYPCYKICKDSGLVVFFKSYNRGIVFAPGSSTWQVGAGDGLEFPEDEFFIPFHGTIKIEVE